MSVGAHRPAFANDVRLEATRSDRRHLRRLTNARGGQRGAVHRLAGFVHVLVEARVAAALAVVVVGTKRLGQTRGERVPRAVAEAGAVGRARVAERLRRTHVAFAARPRRVGGKRTALTFAVRAVVRLAKVGIVHAHVGKECQRQFRHVRTVARDGRRHNVVVEDAQVPVRAHAATVSRIVSFELCARQ